MVERAVVIGLKSIDELGLRGKITIIGIAKGWKSCFRRFYSVIPRQKNLKRSK
jgi:hypothetical protein